MSAFSGKQHKGAMKERRALKSRQADARNALTKPERTRNYRRVMEAASTILREGK
jgi:hypothetical protein